MRCNIALLVALSLAGSPVLADRIGGTARADFSSNTLIVPCVLVNNLGNGLDGRYFDVELERRGNSFNYELSFVELEDSATCETIANFAEFEDVDLDDLVRGQGRGRGSDDDDNAVIVPPTADGVRMFLKCEVDSNATKSEVEIDVAGLVPGDYVARVTSGLDSVESAPLNVRAGERVEFEFDSDADDISRGDTEIPGSFIQNQSVLAAIINAEGATLVSAEARCKLDD
ncbi:MAG: hypothetical protein RQ715_02865 [Methylococcales bacterium]|nr:hypothetical protein [Methylococcales bacterium]